MKLFCLYPNADESFYSYALRLAAGNGYNSAIDIFRLLEIKYRKHVPSIILKSDEEKLSAILEDKTASRLQLVVQQTFGNDKKHDVLAFGKILTSNLFICVG